MSLSLTPAFEFTNQDRADIRRFCGFPPYGTGVTVFFEPWVDPKYLALETRLNNLLAWEGQTVVVKLAELRILDAAIPLTGQNLDTDQAAVWYHNKNELRDRMDLYRTRRFDLCEAIGIEPGPFLRQSGNASSMRAIV